MFRIVLATIFAAAAALKITRFGRWTDSLEAYRVKGSRRGVVAIAVPACEGLVAGLNLLGPPRVGALAALLLLAAFSAGISMSGQRRLPCACFGGARVRDRRFLLARNALIAGLAVAAILWPSAPAPSLSGGDVVPALLVCVGLLASAFTLLGVRRAFRR